VDRKVIFKMKLDTTINGKLQDKLIHNLEEMDTVKLNFLDKSLHWSEERMIITCHSADPLSIKNRSTTEEVVAKENKISILMI